MRKYLLAAAVFGIVLLLPKNGQADDAKAIIEKAIKAHGGPAALAKLKAVKSTSKGNLEIMGQSLSFTETATLQQPDHYRSDLSLEVAGMKISVVVVYDGKNAWIQSPQGTQEAPAEALSEIKNALYAGRAMMLTPLLEDKSYMLSTLGETKVNGKPAVGVKISSKGQKDVDVYFDKDTGLIAKIVRPVLDMGGGEVMEERIVSDYKDVDGYKRASKVVAERGGKKHAEAEVVETKFLDKIDANEFSKP